MIEKLVEMTSVRREFCRPLVKTETKSRHLLSSRPISALVRASVHILCLLDCRSMLSFTLLVISSYHHFFSDHHSKAALA